jgi:Fe2+ or Zn2+ uptake regulation protein
MEKRSTRQKRIVQTFFVSDDCYTAEDIINETGVAKASVYRILKQMVKDHTLHHFQCQGKKVYSKQTKNHCTFTCCKCGVTTHITPNLKLGTQHKVHTINLSLSGTCVTCQEQTK